MPIGIFLSSRKSRLPLREWKTTEDQLDEKGKMMEKLLYITCGFISRVHGRVGRTLFIDDLLQFK